MPIRAITLDFWNTLVDARINSEHRHAQRLRCLLKVARRYRSDLQPVHLEAATTVAHQRFTHQWRRHHRTLGADALVQCFWDELKLNISSEDHTETVSIFEGGVLHGPPGFTDGAVTFVREAARGYRLGLISDTMFSPGRVLRELLDQHDLLSCFDVFIFSDETGYSKPDPRAFTSALAPLGVAPEEAVHIGDLRHTDIAGAQRAGLSAFLYTGVREDPEDGPEPDAIVRHWDAVPSLLTPFS